MTKCQVIQVFMEKVIRDEINPGQKIKPLWVSIYNWIWKRFMHVFSGIQALTERLSKIPQQCEIQFRTRIQF